ncbi:Ankyrin Repeat Domain-Containing Protein 55 [Manis pentadactyla]|nr:Ankyrin Repeat Domain-Containing Protein 55 [Manis pentadactyla]
MWFAVKLRAGLDEMGVNKWDIDLNYDSWWDDKSGNRLIHALLKQENQGPRVSDYKSEKSALLSSAKNSLQDSVSRSILLNRLDSETAFASFPASLVSVINHQEWFVPETDLAGEEYFEVNRERLLKACGTQSVPTAPPLENPSVLMTILEVTCSVGWGDTGLNAFANSELPREEAIR